ncbi:putative dNA repair helicase [Leptomonas pyrrhocoris]|uniref:DNA 3'-5' helicase n=1 Tax=Leptomonas pyrrhocoris TaxID=157538 RepID=A0A0N1J4T9_LEPPY|nr:putative dNA repair helicase [Leptomonas pyrrhocoris]KPA80352.1 putative dNA repair helicase [Leptomonas pyrrhocoris]|eukprot:XP_015658791.1 putative dNA repair helicase [Leptomonas pyrrhocoris]
MNVGASGNIFIERAHPAYEHVVDFLVSCCEPVSRTHHMEQYRMDSSSLSAATAEGTYTLDMIEVILRHFRLNSNQELPVDLERCTALQQLATAVDESTSAVGDDVDLAAGSLRTSPSSPLSLEHAWASGAAARARLPPCIQSMDFSDTVLAPFYPSKHPDHRTQLSSTLPQTVEEERKEMAATGASSLSPPSPPTSSSSGRILQLFRPSSPAAAAAAAVSPTSPTGGAASSPPTKRPLIALAVVRPDDVEQPLPDAIATMLSEEETASRVQIVLQPRLRRFHQFDAGHGGLSSAHAKASKGGDEELFYFVESRQRAHLELVLDALKEFLEPVLLYGKERWILSDVDRSPVDAAVGSNGGGSATRVARDAGRPAVLRMLYEPPKLDPANKVGAHAPSSPTAAAGASASLSPAPASRFIYKCQVKAGKLREVKERLFSRFNIRADCYYDYLQDKTLHVENLNLASHVRLRPYQVASLERFRRGSKAHQGVVVLPCGAGKTLTGIGAAAAMQKTTIVMCVNNMSVFQWQREFLRWTDLTEAEVTVCTAKMKQMPGRVFITTYNMVIAKRGRSDGAAAEQSRAILNAMTAQPWGLLLLDEVHTALAHHFQDVLNTVQYKCVLGLSATLLREDDKIGDLRHLVGPKLYEANWLDLTRAGFLASVECAEVQCPMPLQFLKEYRDVQRARLAFGAGRSAVAKRRRRESVFDVDGDDVEDGPWEGEEGVAGRGRGRRGFQAASMGLNSRALHLASCNPYKLWCTQALLAFHQQRSPVDKVIVFCDYLADVRFFAHHLHLPFMDQRTSEAERANLLEYFQHSPEVNAIILTRVGDVALDLPCASVIIQVSGLGASRRQEAQRLGRILRPKPPSLDNTCAYFYTLVSQDTGDIRTSYKRQSWLRDQGFAYRILHCDRVLGEFVRVGGQPCCVGAPQWWYQTTKAPDEASKSTGPKTTTAARTPVFHEGFCWVPFSLEAALKIERAFQQGRENCVLRAGELGADTLRPSAVELGHYALRPTESWEVTFSSADAPQTFGTVRIGEVGGDVALRVRRVRRGCLDRTHRCTAPDQQDSCVKYALNAVLGSHGAVGALAAGVDVSLSDNDSSDYDDDLPVGNL